MNSSDKNVEYIAAPPTGEYLRSLVNEPLSFSIALGELIDNALDANALRVSVDVGKSKRGSFVVVKDDGEGCANVTDMVCLGKHTEHRTTQLGRYGIGAKNAMLWIGGLESAAIIRSTRNTTTRSLTCAWKEYARRWLLRVPDERPAAVGERGTEITITECIRRFPEGRALEKLLDHLGYTYSRAIAQGRQIQLRVARGKPIIVQPWTPPALTEVVDTQIMVGERTARVCVGIVKDGCENPKPGITYCHGFRVVLKNGPLGCGGYDHANVCGFVDLDKSWHLAKNKNDVSQHKEELGQAVFLALHSMLIKAAQRSHQIQFAQFDKETNTVLNELVGTPVSKVTRRPTGEKPGTVEPVGTPRAKPETSRPGSTKYRRAAPPLALTYGNLGDKGGFGDASDNTIILNTAHPFVAAMRRDEQRAALLMIALMLLAEHKQNEQPNGQRKLSIEPPGVGSAVSRWLENPVSFDGAVVGSDEPANDVVDAAEDAADQGGE